MYSVPKSIPITAEAANAVEENTHKRHNIVERLENALVGDDRRDPGAMANVGAVTAERMKQSFGQPVEYLLPETEHMICPQISEWVNGYGIVASIVQ